MRSAVILFLLCALAAFPQCAPPSTQIYIVADGDSITLGADTPNTPYLSDIVSLLTSSSVTVTSLNNGVSGISWNYAWSATMPANACTMISCAVASIDPVLAIPGYKAKWLILFAGTNGMNLSLGNHSAQQEFAAFMQYYAARISAGWKPAQIIVCTMLPRGVGEESARTAYNALLVQAAGQYSYNLARFDLDSTMGQAGQNSNTTYYLDGTHPTNAGQSILAGILQSVINNLLGSPQSACGASIMSGAGSIAGVIK